MHDFKPACFPKKENKKKRNPHSLNLPSVNRGAPAPRFFGKASELFKPHLLQPIVIILLIAS